MKKDGVIALFDVKVSMDSNLKVTLVLIHRCLTYCSSLHRCAVELTDEKHSTENAIQLSV